MYTGIANSRFYSQGTGKHIKSKVTNNVLVLTLDSPNSKVSIYYVCCNAVANMYVWLMCAVIDVSNIITLTHMLL